MRAENGDRLIIHGHKVGEPDRAATIVEVRGDGGEPPYLVHWDDERAVDHAALVFPGSDAEIRHP